MIKRCFDFVGAAVGLAILFPALLIVALVVKVADGGPVFYRQTRIGKNGRTFRIWKFRTMAIGADKLGPSITKSGDSRVTPIGRRLRKWKIDELPQLLNVLVGEMSLVGPRPEVPKYVAMYTADQRRVLDFKPGITDKASIEFRNEEALLATAEDPELLYRLFCIPRKIEINLEYALRASVLSDLRVIGATFFAIAGFSTRRRPTDSIIQNLR